MKMMIMVVVVVVVVVMMMMMMMMVVGLLHPCALQYTDSASVCILPTGLL
jgi:hypothetical protein